MLMELKAYSVKINVKQKLLKQEAINSPWPLIRSKNPREQQLRKR